MTEGSKIIASLNPYTRSQISFSPAFAYAAESEGEEFREALRRWLLVMLNNGGHDPKVVHPGFVMEWFHGEATAEVTWLDLAQKAMIESWGPAHRVSSPMLNVGAPLSSPPFQVMVGNELKVRPEDQPLPTAGHQPVQAALIRMIEERRELGIKRYGRQLETGNGRDALRDALEEAVDLAAYLMQCVMERDEEKKRAV